MFTLIISFFSVEVLKTVDKVKPEKIKITTTTTTTTNKDNYMSNNAVY